MARSQRGESVLRAEAPLCKKGLKKGFFPCFMAAWKHIEARKSLARPFSSGHHLLLAREHMAGKKRTGICFPMDGMNVLQGGSHDVG